MELNREQIIKALECCIGANDCCENRNCPYYYKAEKYSECRKMLLQDVCAFINSQEQRIFELENRLKECENGYEGTLHLERAKLHDAEEKVKELTQAHKMLSESYDHLEKTKDELLAERSRLTDENERLKSVEFTCGFVKPHKVLECPIFDEIARTKSDTVRKLLDCAIDNGVCKDNGDGTERLFVSIPKLREIAKEMLEGE